MVELWFCQSREAAGDSDLEGQTGIVAQRGGVASNMICRQASVVTMGHFPVKYAYGGKYAISDVLV